MVGLDLSAIPENEEDRQGNCYELSARFILSNPNWSLVHATLYPRAGPFQDRPFDHAFCELNDMIVYDPVFDKFYTRDVYYKFARVTLPKVYTQTDAAKMMVRTKNFGPWEHRSVQND